ncbi:MAG: hypothetical protein KC620_24775, partial [Myxococcales bacterium]|nr:hypothetical protein [Myxococcales bacterium]
MKPASEAQAEDAPARLQPRGRAAYRDRARPQTTGAALAGRLDALGWSALELAERVKEEARQAGDDRLARVSHRTILRWIDGRPPLDESVAEGICGALGLGWSELRSAWKAERRTRGVQRAAAQAVAGPFTLSALSPFLASHIGLDLLLPAWRTDAPFAETVARPLEDLAHALAKAPTETPGEALSAAAGALWHAFADAPGLFAHLFISSPGWSGLDREARRRLEAAADGVSGRLNDVLLAASAPTSSVPTLRLLTLHFAVGLYALIAHGRLGLGLFGPWTGAERPEDVDRAAQAAIEAFAALLAPSLADEVEAPSANFAPPLPAALPPPPAAEGLPGAPPASSGGRLAAAMAEAGMTLREVANRARDLDRGARPISHMAVARWLGGDPPSDQNAARAIADAVGLDAVDYEPERVDIGELYPGHRSLDVPEADIRRAFDAGLP